MDKIIQTQLYRQSLILYAQKHGVTQAAIRYRTNRQYIYRWMKRYDGTLPSLADRSHRPHHPNQHMYSYSVVPTRQNGAFGEEKSAQVFTLERFDYVLCSWRHTEKI